jgi:hypothetical protein
MYVKDLIKELTKYPSDYLVRVRIDNSFWNNLTHKENKIKMTKKLKWVIDDALSMPNYWIEEIENTSVDCGKEITLWGEY